MCKSVIDVKGCFLRHLWQAPNLKLLFFVDQFHILTTISPPFPFGEFQKNIIHLINTCCCSRISVLVIISTMRRFRSDINGRVHWLFWSDPGDWGYFLTNYDLTRGSEDTTLFTYSAGVVDNDPMDFPNFATIITTPTRTVINATVTRCPERKALGIKRDGVWVTWTYRHVTIFDSSNDSRGVCFGDLANILLSFEHFSIVV